MSHDHHHSAAAEHRGRLAVVFAITVAVLVVEVVGAALSGSLALFADAGHVLADGAGIGLALLAIRFAARPTTPQRTLATTAWRSWPPWSTPCCCSGWPGSCCWRPGGA